MISLAVVIGTLILYLVAYNTYGKYLARKIFNISQEATCPSETEYDGIDFVPTRKGILFGHHFASIAGTGPIVGPAIAIIWGWVPALIWILLGSIFMGAVHDFGSMVISLKNRGHSIGEIAGSIITPRVRILFLMIIFFALLIVVAIFGVVIAAVFNKFPEAVIPVWTQIPIAIWLSFQIKKGRSQLLFGLIAVVAMYATMLLGARFPLEIPQQITSTLGITPLAAWLALLLIYAYIASILPVQVLLQPRDYINAFQLVCAMGLILLGILITQPAMSAPAVDLYPRGAPPIAPILFITVACGAISGFHSLVSSGTSAKQCENQTNALPIAYGGMLLEGVLAVFVIIACGAGLGLGLETEGGTLTGTAAFSHHYSSWTAAKGLGSKLDAFVVGAANMISALGISKEISITLMGVFVASFAATTLDTATRIQRYIVGELGTLCKVPVLNKKHPGTLVAVGTALLLAFCNGSGKGALLLWPLFGSVNQLLAGLALLVLTIHLAKQKKPFWVTLLPMLLVVGFTSWAMGINLLKFYNSSNWLLLFIGTATFALELWMVCEGALVLKKVLARKTCTS